ncbi:hypothetical protein WME99_46160 [Sorangium sp. So ce136]|uniref:hypothetical protein n=1 Tax=Sorangium sp. So ce136 TaxID=3133284 RepID=UPI003F020A0D
MRLQQSFSFVVALAVTLSAIGCSGDPPESEGAGGQAGHGSATASSAGGHGGQAGHGSTTASGAGGHGGEEGSAGGGGTDAAPDFALFIVPATVDIPYDATTSVDLSIRRFNGFDAPIEVIVNAPPEGLVVAPLEIPAGASTAALEVGASGELTVDTTFNLELVARSDDLLRFAAVTATVVAAAP